MSATPPVERAELLGLGKQRRYERGDELMREGDTGDDSFVITKGFVKVIGTNREGNPTLLAVRVEGDIVGEIAVLDGGPRSATVVAAGPTWTSVIDGQVLREFLDGHPVTARVLQGTITAKLRESTHHRVDLNGVPVVRKVAKVIRKLGRAYGEDSPDGLLIGVPLSQADLAALVGSTEQSVRRALAELRESGLITTRYRRIHVADAPGLRSVAEGGDTLVRGTGP